jgi:hypothetical protein
VNNHSVKRPTDASEMNTPQNTAECRQSSPEASSHDNGIRETDRRDGGRAELRDEVDVDDGERRLEDELEHHRHGQQEHGAPQRNRRMVGVRTAERVAQLGVQRSPPAEHGQRFRGR